MAPEDREVTAVDPLGGLGAGLGELSGQPPDAHHLAARAALEVVAELVEHTDAVVGLDGAALLQALRAVARLEDEALAARDRGERPRSRMDLRGVRERRRFGEPRGDLAQLGVVAPAGLLRVLGQGAGGARSVRS